MQIDNKAKNKVQAGNDARNSANAQVFQPARYLWVSDVDCLLSRLLERRIKERETSLMETDLYLRADSNLRKREKENSREEATKAMLLEISKYL